MTRYALLIMIIATTFISCNDFSKNVSEQVDSDIKNTKSSVGELNDSNDVIFESVDTVLIKNEHLQIERLKLGKEEIVIKTKFKGSKSNDVLSIRNYEGLQVIFKGDTINNFIKEIDGIRNDNPMVFLPAFRGDSIDNIEGFEYKNLITEGNQFWILTGYFYGCNGSFCDNGILLVLKKGLVKKESKAFLIGIRRASIEGCQYIANGDSLIIKAKLNQENKTVALDLLNNEIKLDQEEDRDIYSKAFFRIR